MDQQVPHSSSISLNLFGSPLLLTDGKVTILGRRARAVLGYLALSNANRATRERLIGLFWPDRGEAQSRASLRQCLAELRGAMGHSLSTGREWVALATDGLTGDWWSLEAAIASEDPTLLTAAIKEINGEPLLHGMEFGEAFDDWLRSSRAALDVRLAITVLQRVEAARDADKLSDALTLADAWLIREPLDEAVVTTAIAIEVAQNAFISARKRFRNFESALKRAGEAPPGPTLRAALENARPAIVAATQTVDIREAAKPNIAVLLFRHPPNDLDQAYFAEGMADDIIAGLARSRMMRVLSRQSSLAYAAEGVTTARICADLGVRYLVRGHIRRLGPTMRVTVDLVDGEHDQQIWSERYDRPLVELFSVQDAITMAIVATIEPALLGREQQIAMRATHGLQHWDLLMRGRHHFWRSTLDDWAQAADLLKQALTLAPDDAPTLALLAMVELSGIWVGQRRDVMAMLGRAYDYSMRATTADPRDSGAHHALGIVLAFMGQTEQAFAEQRLALELNPASAQARGELGRLLAFAGEATDAIASIDEAIALSPTDPHDWLWHRSKAIACFSDGRAKQAVIHALDACARRPDYFFLHFLIAVCQSAAGNMVGARAACARGLEMHPRYSKRAMHIGHPFASQANLEKFEFGLRNAGWQG